MIMSLKNKKEKAVELRQRGFSYGQILKELELSSKGTLSNWFKDLVLSRNAKSKLKKNYIIATKQGLDKFNKKRSHDILNENIEAIEKGKQEVKISNNRDLLILGAALYWGEGTKYIGKNPSLIFTNSDPDMIRVYMRFLREALCLDESLIKAGIHIHPYIDKRKAKCYWAKISGLPKDLFYIVNVISSASKGKRSPRKLPYGIVVIKVNRRQIFYRVKGIIDGLKK